MELEFLKMYTKITGLLFPQSEDRAQFEMLKSQMYAERAAKRDRKPKRARAMPEDEPVQKGDLDICGARRYCHQTAPSERIQPSLFCSVFTLSGEPERQQTVQEVRV